MRFLSLAFLSASAVLTSATFAQAGDYWWSGDWYVKAGVTGFSAPRYQGASSYLMQAKPLFSLGKAGQTVRFTSRNDNPAMSLYDQGAFRAGLTGKLVMPRNGDESDDIKGLDKIKLGAELGVFAETYATDWLRIKGEVRHGIRSHQGLVADLSADAFFDVTPTVRVSAGPRVTIASQDYMQAYYGVDARAAKKSGLTPYRPDSGIESAGVGGEINWQATDRIEAGLFADYKRLMGPAAESSLVRERGSRNQALIGISASYRFGFTIP